MKVIPGEFQYASVIAKIDKRKIRKVLRKTCAVRRKIALLKDVKIRKRLEEKKLNWLMLEHQICGALQGWGFKGMF